MKSNCFAKCALLLFVGVIASLLSFSQVIIPYGSSWKYWDSTFRPVGWESSIFDDGIWGSGNAELGYGDGDEAKIITYGANPSNKHRTAYFRKSINIVSPTSSPSFTFNVERDDGFILYVNGIEVARNNMPAVVPTHTTQAIWTTEDSVVNITVPAIAFSAGNNVIAVEVHQINATSSDLSFNLQLTANPAGGTTYFISNGGVWKYWDQNSRPAGWETTGFSEVGWLSGAAELGYGDGDESSIISFGPTSGDKYRTAYFRKSINIANPLSYSNFTFNVERDDGFVLYVNGVEVGRNNMPAGIPTQSTFAVWVTEDSVVNVTVPNTAFSAGNNVIAVELHQINAGSSDLSFNLQLTAAPGVPTTNFISNSATWKYLDNNTRPSGWETSSFDDALWASGPAKLGYSDGATTTVSFGPDQNNKYITTYFRKVVNIPNPSSFESFTINMIRDDGAIVYINGVEVFKSNMPPVAVTHNLYASRNIGGVDETTDTSYTVATSYFVAGDNTIAVEVHQDDPASSDLGFRLVLNGNGTASASPVFMNTNDIWKFLDNGTDQGTDWQTTGFDDALWKSGHAKLGFSPNGEDNEVTLVEFGPDPANKYITTYFRRNFNLPDLSSFASITLNIIRDDGIIVYVNGVEVARDNMPVGDPNYLTEAPNIIGDAAETTPVVFSIPTTYFSEGINTIVVEVHQRPGGVSTDLSFSMQMLGSTTPVGASTVTRGPYLQMGSETAINIRWRTTTATDSRVEIGTEFGTYPIIVDSVDAVTDHEVRVTGLTPDTKYYYRIGTTTGFLQGTVDNFFTTMPPANTTRKIRIAAFGDCGNNQLNNRTNSLNQYRNYIASNGIDAVDAWLILGDNAYDGDTDPSYQEDFFTPYATNLLLNHKLFSTPGNHDYSNLSRTSRIIPYYQVFSMPKAGECGGVPSGTEAYYSFDVGNVHILSLDSYGQELSGNTRMYDTLGPQVTWVKQDLAANTKKWVIAYWHHPPYTMGSHNSDSEAELVNIRFNFMRILERYGVDLIVCGHSHVYERSKLIKGHYGLEASYSDAAHAVNTSSGKYIDNTSCPYITQTGASNHGTVYVVSGSAGSSSGGVQGGFPHNATPYAFDEGGMFYIEVDDNRLDAKFIRANPDATHPLIADQFTIFQNVDTAFVYSIASGNPITLTASWPGNYNWSTTATTRAITVTPPEGTTNYTVTDNFNCITDQFVVHANVCTAEINTWVGNKSTAWENGLNWSCGVVPGPTSEVVIKLGTPYQATVNSNVIIKKLTMQSGANVIVNTGFTVDVTGN